MSGETEPTEPAGLAGSDTVLARLAVQPVRPCPVTRLASQHGIRQLVPPGRMDRAPQVVVDVDADDPAVEGLRSIGAHPVARMGSATVCRLPALERPPGTQHASACGHGHCLAHGFGFLPLDPYHTRWEADVLHCSFAAMDTRTVERTTRAFGDADFVVELEQLVRAEQGIDSLDADRQTLVTLDTLTERQREVAAEAIARGYLDPDGPSADEVAADLDISKATLSQHVGTVERELLRQVFSARD